MIYPAYEELEKYTENYKTVPVGKEIFSDFCTPVQVLRILKGASKHVFILESVERQEKWGRYTFLGYDPAMEIVCNDGQMHVKEVATGEVKNYGGEENFHPAPVLRELLAAYKSPKIAGMPSFTGGMVGYFSFDYMKYSEPQMKGEPKNEDGFHDFDLMLFDKVIAFDNLKQKLWLIVNVKTENMEENYQKALSEIEAMEQLLRTGKPTEDTKGKLLSEIKPLYSKEQYCDMVNKAKHYIHEGDIFQVVLSNRLEADYEGSLLDTFRYMRTINPSPYMFYFASSDLEVAGASPETLVKLEDGELHTYPLAGTRPRGKNAEEDEALRVELLADEKERAEHNMLVDLGRNDIGKISKFGSVKVEKYMNIEKFSHVMHIGSTVRGEIDDKHDGLDAIDAILPAGTLSGAPKIRACEIIRELENNKRGVYGGAIGYLDFTGNMDTCIAIRIAYKKGGKVFVRSGAGIVADSVPEKEYQECINKAKAVVTSLQCAQEVDA
ncbi:MAG: anthranilate synthase component I [Lachnospiraceae bacterium]|nr:anthranilate synthase component I [Lachnospiraceae bacterium]